MAIVYQNNSPIHMANFDIECVEILSSAMANRLWRSGPVLQQRLPWETANPDSVISLR
jgi:hypothetical protein